MSGSFSTPLMEDLYPGSKFKASKKPPPNSVCDVCGKIAATDSVYHRKKTEHEEEIVVHRTCADNLPKELNLDAINAVFHLLKPKPGSACNWCKELNPRPDIKGHRYESGRCDCTYHVSCLMDMPKPMATPAATHCGCSKKRSGGWLGPLFKAVHFVLGGDPIVTSAVELLPV